MEKNMGHGRWNGGFNSYYIGIVLQGQSDWAIMKVSIASELLSSDADGFSRGSWMVEGAAGKTCKRAKKKSSGFEGFRV